MNMRGLMAVAALVFFEMPGHAQNARQRPSEALNALQGMTDQKPEELPDAPAKPAGESAAAAESSWHYDEARVLFSDDRLSSDLPVGDWLRVARVDSSDPKAGQLDMRGLQTESPRGQIMVVRKDNPLQKDFLYITVAGEAEGVMTTARSRTRAFTMKEANDDRSGYVRREGYCGLTPSKVLICLYSFAAGPKGAVRLEESYEYGAYIQKPQPKDADR